MGALVIAAASFLKLESNTCSAELEVGRLPRRASSQ